MDFDKPAATQILMAWRDNRWVVARDTVEVGLYAYRSHAMEKVRAIAAEERDAGRRCYMLLRDKDGSWQERSCPKPRRRVARGDASD